MRPGATGPRSTVPSGRPGFPYRRAGISCPPRGGPESGRQALPVPYEQEEAQQGVREGEVLDRRITVSEIHHSDVRRDSEERRRPQRGRPAREQKKRRNEFVETGETAVHGRVSVERPHDARTVGSAIGDHPVPVVVLATEQLDAALEGEYDEQHVPDQDSQTVQEFVRRHMAGFPLDSAPPVAGGRSPPVPEPHAAKCPGRRAVPAARSRSPAPSSGRTPRRGMTKTGSRNRVQLAVAAHRSGVREPSRPAPGAGAPQDGPGSTGLPSPPERP